MNKKRIKLIGATLLALAVAIVVMQNRGEVETEIFFATVTMPQAVLLLLVAVVSFAAGILATLFARSKPKPAE